MLISKEVKVFVNMSKYQYYTEKGYIIKTHIDKDKHIRIPRNSYIIVKIKDLPNDSCAMVDVVCDYCGKHIFVKYKDFLSRHKKVNKDCCNDCKGLKISESNMAIYGTNSMIKRAKIQNFKVGRNVKFSNEEIIDYFKNRDLIVQTDLLNLSKNLLVKDEIPYICKNHIDKGIQYVSFDVLRNRKYCCIYGANEIFAINQSKSSINEVIDICNKRNYKLLTKYIRSVDDKIEYICNKHPNYGIQTTSLYGLRKYNYNCRMCRQYSGKKHWNWQGGISKERDSIKNTPEYKNWRKSVFERDDYTCQCCGNRGKKLNAHHIENFSSHPELRLNIDNGITLCENCHSINIKGSFHNLYGTYNNTKQQLNEYINNIKQQENQNKDSLLLCLNE